MIGLKTVNGASKPSRSRANRAESTIPGRKFWAGAATTMIVRF